MGYDAWLTTDHSIEDVAENWELLRRCSCGCFLRAEPDRTEFVEKIVDEEMPGGYTERQDWSYHRLTHSCRRCKRDNVFDEQ